MNIPKHMIEEMMPESEQLSAELIGDLRDFKRLWLTGEYEYPALVEQAMNLPQDRINAIDRALFSTHAEDLEWRNKITKRVDAAIDITSEWRKAQPK